MRSTIIVIAMLASERFAAADAITFTGSSIALRNCRVEALQGGQVFYADARGQRQRRAIEEVQAIAFDDLPLLEAAEKTLGSANDPAGLVPLLATLLECKTELHKQWVRYRLVRFHEAHGETVQAIGHAAAIMGGSDDPSWKSAEPVAELNDAAYPAVKEAYDNLLAALRTAKHAELKATLERMNTKIQPLHERLAREQAGTARALGGTLSGIPVQSVRSGDAKSSAANPALELPAPPKAAPAKPIATPATAPSPEPSKSLEAPTTDANSPQAIESLLERARYVDALSRCVTVAKDPGDRDLAQFLSQYGLALARNGKPDDAAVMFTRCAALYPTSEHACHSLIQLAILHRDAFADKPTAQRLLALAQARAAEHGHAAAAMLASELMPSVAK